MKRVLFIKIILVLIIILSSQIVSAQGISVNPTGVNINPQSATTVFLTFGGLNNNQSPAEGCWCGELISAAPDIGFKCNPATIFGCLPSRFNQSTRSGNQGFTDIMSIPPSVARRAYQAALNGQTSSFFYVRRFVNSVGGPDEFVVVTCRMAGGGARTPFALTNVEISFDVDKPVLLVIEGEEIPQVKAEIKYNGTGRLKGRWEVVMPGEELPDVRDLLTEATLPVEQRGLQKRYTQLSRFNVFLSPNGKYTLPGPEPPRLPNKVKGQYLVLLRIEVSDDKEGDSNLSAVGAGAGVVHSGAIAGFPLPVLRYYVGSSASDQQIKGKLALVFPLDRTELEQDQDVKMSWTEFAQASFYRLEIEDTTGNPIFSAVLLQGGVDYHAPSWLKDRIGNKVFRWRVIALNNESKVIDETTWRSLKFKTTTKK